MTEQEQGEKERRSVILAREIMNIYAPGEFGMMNRLVSVFDAYEAEVASLTQEQERLSGYARHKPECACLSHHTVTERCASADIEFLGHYRAGFVEIERQDGSDGVLMTLVIFFAAWALWRFILTTSLPQEEP
jgi:hypothetical protein